MNAGLQELGMLLNRKHEMFLNANVIAVVRNQELLNRKHEMFLNVGFSFRCV